MKGETANMAKAKRVTSTEVAKLAGVSQATVSMVLSGSERASFSEDTKKRVLNAAKALNYQLPAQRSAKRAHAKMILVLIPTLTNPYYSELVQVLEQYSDTVGYRMIVCNTFRKVDMERYYLEQVLSSQYSGIIYTFLPSLTEQIAQIAGRMPVVLIGEKTDALPICSIELNNRRAGVILADHLYELGHRHIAFISTPIGQLTLARGQRLEGMRDRVQELAERDGCRDARVDALVCGDESTDAEMTAVGTSFEFNIGKKLTAEFLASGNTATALVGANDMIAFGIISQLRSSGLRVPKDYSVCGFDNVFTSSMVTPGLTSIDHRLMARCRTAIQMIIQQDNLEDSMAEKIEYTPQLVARNSTAAPIAGKSGNGACDS